MNIPKKESSIRENYFEKIYIAFFVSVVIFLFLYRIIHGADLTDESFYCTLILFLNPHAPHLAPP